MNSHHARLLAKRKRRIARRLKPRNFSATERPVFRATSPRYEVADRAVAVRAGGIGAVHAMAKSLGLVAAIDGALPLLKVHLPYHESDHVLAQAYNLLAGHTCLEDLELLRRDEGFTHMVGAPRIPDPTTAGDFLRRFREQDVRALMDAINGVRARVWAMQPEDLRREAVIDVDGTMAPTCGEKKEGMSLSYKGEWGYHPLLVSLANFREPLFLVNREGSAPSHAGAAEWIDRAIDLCAPHFGSILVRGDTDFSLTANFDRWTERGVRFVFGYDAKENLVKLAEAVPDAEWKPLPRAVRTPATGEREKRDNAKERVVVEKGYRNLRLEGESYAEIAYRPGNCKRDIRMVIVRKDIAVEEGGRWLFNDWRYFFYATNAPALSAEEVVAHARARCDQENLIDQVKNGVHATRLPSHDLVSNWAYMVIASLAWTLKAWTGLTLPRKADRADVVRMDFKRFLHAMMLVPCQVVRAGRRVVLRLLAYTDHARLLFRSMEASARLRFT